MRSFFNRLFNKQQDSISISIAKQFNENKDRINDLINKGYKFAGVGNTQGEVYLSFVLGIHDEQQIVILINE